MKKSRLRVMIMQLRRLWVRPQSIEQESTAKGNGLDRYLITPNKARERLSFDTRRERSE